ncbi:MULTISPECIES: hypothetical protein [unclassified Legionella]|uniref:hypothetical protein n=1 Tax=unclassified Legionella TaxID=2622702 RepID=UPI0010543494|nr:MULTISPECIES: hypothetical protein [unclassified Legionella]MDI9819358.1 hypothetical protein [Legionella sp. PL877]
MKFYFNTPDQINADEAFNNKEYEKALQLYNHALQTLQQPSASDTGMELSTMNDLMGTPDTPSIKPALAPRLLKGIITPASTPVSSNETTKCSQAFMTAIESIITPSVNPKFLANLLSLAADFFRQYQCQSVPTRTFIVLAFDLYQQVRMINSEHKRARHFIEKILKDHPEMLDDYTRFNQAPANRRGQDDRKIFNQALEEMTTQLETLMITTPESLELTMNLLVDSITNNLDSIIIKAQLEKSPLAETFSKIYQSEKSLPESSQGIEQFL